MSKKDKADLDLDFSEIGTVEGSLEEAESRKRVIKKKPSAVKKDKFAEIVLSIPAKGEQSKFVSKTMGECSGLEFVTWAKNVAYPLEESKEHYDELPNRRAAFMKIITFHRKNFILANPDAIKTLH